MYENSVLPFYIIYLLGVSDGVVLQCPCICQSVDNNVKSNNFTIFMQMIVGKLLSE